MEAELIMSIVSAAAATVGVASSLLTVRFKADAERRFLAILSSEDRARLLRALRNRVMHDGVATAEELQQLRFARWLRWGAAIFAVTCRPSSDIKRGQGYGLGLRRTACAENTRAGVSCASTGGWATKTGALSSVVLVVQAPEGGEQRLHFLGFFDEVGLRLLGGGELAHGAVVRGVLVEVLEHADGNIQQSARALTLTGTDPPSLTQTDPSSFLSASDVRSFCR